mmetsp:Transcript_13600/g.28277  ORF Transcript_13600/g.28277 Transcript_13600/m.28277 type:complete len:244 (+) Transcript_13600:4174-4905(+)
MACFVNSAIIIFYLISLLSWLLFGFRFLCSFLGIGVTSSSRVRRKNILSHLKSLAHALLRSFVGGLYRVFFVVIVSEYLSVGVADGLELFFAPNGTALLGFAHGRLGIVRDARIIQLVGVVRNGNGLDIFELLLVGGECKIVIKHLFDGGDHRRHESISVCVSVVAVAAAVCQHLGCHWKEGSFQFVHVSCRSRSYHCTHGGYLVSFVVLNINVSLTPGDHSGFGFVSSCHKLLECSSTVCFY